MEQLHLLPTCVDGPVGVQAHDAVRFDVSWEWESDTNRYWLSHTVIDPTTTERIVHGSSCFKWKDIDAVGDCGLVLRWLREARRYLATPTRKPSHGR